MKAKPWEYQFPKISNPNGLTNQLVKIETEAAEAVDAYAACEGDVRVAEELMDVIHAAETALRMLGFQPLVVDAIKEGVILKNKARGYYGGAE